jgi:hypothetical protein
VTCKPSSYLAETVSTVYTFAAPKTVETVGNQRERAANHPVETG